MTPRWFICLRSHENDWVVNLLMFDGATIHQFNTWSGDQESPCDEVVYDNANERLFFVPSGGTSQVFQAVEVVNSFGQFLVEPDKWKKLQHGMSIKSEKTLAWLRERISTCRVRIPVASPEHRTWTPTSSRPN